MGGFTGFFFGLMFGCSLPQAICAFVVGFLLRMFLLWIGKFNLNSFILSVISGGFISITCQLIYVLGSEYTVANKDDARSFINRLRQKFIDWNYEVVGSEDYKNLEAALDEQVRKQVK